jgi:hypothetical protein
MPEKDRPGSLTMDVIAGMSASMSNYLSNLTTALTVYYHMYVRIIVHSGSGLRIGVNQMGRGPFPCPLLFDVNRLIIQKKVVAVGKMVTHRPPHRSRRAELPHRALALDHNARLASG